MLINSILFIFLILFSIGLFFINNLMVIVILLLISIILIIVMRIHLYLYKTFIFLLIINFTINYLLSNLNDALIVTLRLIVMFLVVNIIIKKIGILNLGKIIGTIFHSKSVELMITISLSFIPILSKELKNIKNSLKVKNFNLNLKNVLLKPHIFVVTYFSILFKRINEMEKVFVSRGIEE